jgi:trypsin
VQRVVESVTILDSVRYVAQSRTVLWHCSLFSPTHDFEFHLYTSFQAHKLISKLKQISLNMKFSSRIWLPLICFQIQRAMFAMAGTSGNTLRGNSMEVEDTSYHHDDARWLEEENESRIIGGQEAAINRYPYLAALYSTAVDKTHPICGGMLIHANVILTAAHCIELVDAVLLGAHDLSTAEVFALGSEPNKELHMIGDSQKITHPEYNEVNLKADFALIILKDPSSKTPVQINTNSSQPSIGEKVYAIGWGVVYESWFSKTVSSVPLEVELATMSMFQCQQIYTDISFHSYINFEAMLCAYAPGKDACQGDSGGPLITKGSNPSDPTQHVLQGVVSWGYGCADGYPGVYSRVSYASEWIQQNIP